MKTTNSQDADASCFYTNSTDVAAALTSMGFQMKKTRPFVRTFTESAPEVVTDPKTGRTQPGIGKFVFRVERHSPNFRQLGDGDAFLGEWWSRKSSTAFHEKLDFLKAKFSEAVTESAKNPHRAQFFLQELHQHFTLFRSLVPGAILCYLAQASQNRAAIIDKIKEVVRTNEDKPYRRYDHGKGAFTLVPADLPEAEVDKLLLRARRRNS